MQSDHFLDRLSLSVAQEIELELAKSHEGGASQRMACVQVIVRNALKNVMDGALAASWQQREIAEDVGGLVGHHAP